MATIFCVRRNADEEARSAGGKIVRRSRRTPPSARIPYARPEEPTPSSATLNWLSCLIYPARVIASGAGKIFSTVLAPESSSSSGGGTSDSEYEDDVSLVGDDETNKNMKSEKVDLIRQLVTQETFSREEGSELIKLIQSRVVKGNESISDTAKNPDVHSTAIMEARRWLEYKKSGSSSKLKAEDQMCQTNQGNILSLVSESETGSPVHMAKTYMLARPAWSSPSLKHVEFRTSSLMENFREELSRSIFHSPLQLLDTRRSSLSTGPWNIMEEIRKVRAKATEELLATTPSKRIDLLSFSPENKSRQKPFTKIKNEAEPGEEFYNMPYRTSSAASNPSLELATTNCSVLPESVEIVQDRSQNEAPQTNNVQTLPQNEDTIQAIQSAGVPDGCQKPNEINGSREFAATGHALSLSAADQTSEPCDKEIGVIDISRNKVDMEVLNEKSEDEDELSNAVHANDNNSIWTGCQNSSNAQHDDLLKDATQSNPKCKASLGRPIRGYSRRGRGRGK